MKKLISSVLAVLLLTVVLGVSAEARGGCGKRTPLVRQRQQNQQRRIGRGVRSGELTARERAKLHRELNQSSRHIYRAKHNERDRN